MSSYAIIFTKSYSKKSKMFFQKHPELLKKYKKVLTLIQANPFHPSLRLHKLKGKLKSLHSISIDMSYRITVDFYIEKNLVIPIAIGSHDEAYS
ncbi:plasmid stabilization protein [Candidatus Peregrinibacteria bacterium]|jgi:mRNA-degrading endonuclease YafQ of YafQ-DinJ toxin-antitoxin module|nr:plasmid stabilization protein [Candidatus Peregrinibacteria bacterium]